MPEQQGNVTLKFVAEGGDRAVEATRHVADALQSATKATSPLADGVRRVVAQFTAARAAGDGFGAAMAVLNGLFSAALTPVGMLAVGLGALVGMIHKTAEAAKEAYFEVRNLMAVSGLAADKAEGLRYAFEASGLQAGNLQAAMFRLGAVIEMQPAVLERLGISAREPGEAFIELQRRMHDLGDESKINAATLPLLGRAAREMAPLWKMNSDEFQRFIEHGARLSNMSEELMQRTRALIKAETDLRESTQSSRLEFAEFVSLPVEKFFAQALGAIGHLAKGMGDWKTLPIFGFPMFGRISEEAGARHVKAVKETGEKAAAAARERTEHEKLFDVQMQQRRFALQEQEAARGEAVAEERVKRETASDVAVLAARRAFVAQRRTLLAEEEAAEHKAAADRGTLGIEATEDRIMIEQKYLAKREELAGQERKLDEDLYRARAADARQAAQIDLQQLAQAEQARRQSIEYERSITAALLDAVETNQTAKTLANYAITERATEQRYESDLSFIAARTRALQTELAAVAGNAEEERRITEELTQLGAHRVEAEQEHDTKIVEARARMVQELNAQADREAGIGENLLQQAAASLRKRHILFATAGQLQAEAGRLQAQREAGAATFAAGGRVALDDVSGMGLTPTLGDILQGAGQAREMQRGFGTAAVSPFFQSEQERLAGSFGPAHLRTPVTAGVSGMAVLERASGTMDRAVDRFERAVEAFAAKAPGAGRAPAANGDGAGEPSDRPDAVRARRAEQARREDDYKWFVRRLERESYRM